MASISTRRRLATLKPRRIIRYQSTLQASTLDHGFKLQPRPLQNPFSSDSAYQRILSWYLPSSLLEELGPKLQKFGDEAISPRIQEFIGDAERNTPILKTRDVWNRRYDHDRLITSTGWKELGKWGIENGVVALAYEPKYAEHSRIVQHAFNYIYSASSAVYSCPVSMTSGAARLFGKLKEKEEDGHLFHEIFRRLTSRKWGANWISSQWMTERPGGSDVQNSETLAVFSPLALSAEKKKGFEQGDYLISGYKFFCSATDCDIALMLAKDSEDGKLGLFVAPTKVKDEENNGRMKTNGIRFHRLKTKMGTKELPTAELELKDVRAWRVGPPGRGIATIAMLLNTTRTHNFITALSCWRRGMAIAKTFALARTTINQPLATFPMHLRLLSRMEIKFNALLQLAFFTTSILSYSDNGFPSSSTVPLPRPGEQSQIILRALTATTKGVICKLACISLQECQEAMGGVGYMDEPDEPEFNVSRLYRDTAANMTWEGTTNVLSSEVVRHLMKGENLGGFGEWVEESVGKIEDGEVRERLRSAWKDFVMYLETRRHDLGVLLADGREVMFSLAWIVSGVLLAHDAQRDGEAVAGEIARRWILDGDVGVGEFVLPGVVHPSSPRGASGRRSDREKVNWDCQIVWGEDLPPDAAAGYRVSPEAGPGAGEGRVRPAL